MIETLRVIVFAETTPLKMKMIERLRSLIDELIHVESSIEGLKAVTAGQFDAAVISEDIERYSPYLPYPNMHPLLTRPMSTTIPGSMLSGSPSSTPAAR